MVVLPAATSSAVHRLLTKQVPLWCELVEFVIMLTVYPLRHLYEGQVATGPCTVIITDVLCFTTSLRKTPMQELK